MKTLLIVSTLFFLTLASCDNFRNQEKPKQKTPKALENKNYTYKAISRSDNDDLVESLYKELADKTVELKELDNRIETISKSKSDSIQTFDNYKSKNQSFYRSADNQINKMNDSVLKEKMKVLIASSLTKYKSSIAQHNDLLKSIEAKSLNLDDLYTVLKITRTLPLIDQYQHNNLPNKISLEGLYNQLNEVAKYTDTLIKK